MVEFFNTEDEEILNKDFTQRDKIDDVVIKEQLDEMAFIWKETMLKLKEDDICFCCKNTLPKETKTNPNLNNPTEKINSPMFFIVKTNSEKGTLVLCSLCPECFDNLKTKPE